MKLSTLRLVALVSYEGGEEKEIQCNTYSDLTYPALVAVEGVLGQAIVDANSKLGGLGIIAKM